MSKQPKALLLANILEHQIPSIACLEIAATELRRLHEVNQELMEELTELLSWQSLAPGHVVVSAKIILAKAIGYEK
jgi:hypothetical protein